MVETFHHSYMNGGKINRLTIVKFIVLLVDFPVELKILVAFPVRLIIELCLTYSGCFPSCIIIELCLTFVMFFWLLSQFNVKILDAFPVELNIELCLTFVMFFWLLSKFNSKYLMLSQSN